MNSTLSIGIPIYNQAGTIRKTVESALAQHVPFHEVVVSDNHSTDGTSEILASFGDRIRVVRPPVHLRMTENWNFCIEHIQTEWFALLSGDDLVHPDFAAQIGAAARHFPLAGLIRTDWQLVDEKGFVIRKHHQWSVRRYTRRPRTWLEQLNGPKVSFAAFAVKTDLWRKAGGYPVEFHLIQDWIFALKVAALTDFVRIPHVLASYRVAERPDLEAKRMALYIEDEWRYVTQILSFVPASLEVKRRVAGQRLTALIARLNDVGVKLFDEPTRLKIAEIADVADLQTSLETWISDPSQEFKGRAPSVLDRLKANACALLRRIG